MEFDLLRGRALRLGIPERNTHLRKITIRHKESIGFIEDFDEPLEPFNETEHIYIYDEQGNLTESFWFSNDTLATKDFYLYDEQGCLSQRYYYQKNLLTSKTTFFYDENDRLIQIKFYEGSHELRGKTSFIYDKDGNLLQKYYLWDNANAEPYRAYRYDEQGRRTHKIEYTNGIIRRAKEYFYDECGRLVKKAYYRSNGSLYKYIQYYYDASGRPLCAREFDGHGFSMEKNFMEYDSEGKLTQRQCIARFGRVWKDVCHYSPAGNLMWEDLYSHGQLLGKYIYDDRGTLYREISFYNKDQDEAATRFCITERDIEYR